MGETLRHGQRLHCGCVVGEYWCGPHDIYAMRVEVTQTWGGSAETGFYLRTLPRNDHRPLSDFMPIRYPSSGDESGCSCHINAPCARCEATSAEEDVVTPEPPEKEKP